MQKACEIIAIGAIVLSASQFASAQTSLPDQSPQTAGKPALRDQVKDALQQAGFKNIRIISESFLVRAIDQNGDPVVMVIRPDSLRTMRAPASGDKDEANADEPGRPDPWSDFSENDEEQATAPTPRSGHIGKSSKMTDRPPAVEGDQQAQAGQDPGNGEANDAANNTANDNTAKSAKMTDRQKNSGAAEQSEANQAPSQSAKMRDGSSSLRADNKTIAGRSNGTMTEMKESEQGALNLTAAQRAEIWQRLGKQQGTNAPPGFQPTVGATVPATMQLKTLPSSVLSQVPQIQSYHYAMLQSQLLIVDPTTKKIVSIITE
jgi:hypothetical protein